jgi:MFS family permease
MARQLDVQRQASTRSLRALDWANFFLADVRDGVGPYLGIYLLASHNWHPSSIGIAMAAMGIATVVAQTPAGAFIDNTNKKRLVMAVAAAGVAVCCILMTIPAFVNLYAIVFFQVLMGIAAAVLLPGIAAITLGVVGYKRFPARQGRNEMFNHAGNVVAAILAGLLGHFIAREFLFYAVVLFSLASMVAVLRIRREDIDDRLARGAKKSDEEDAETTAGFREIFANKTILVFALSVVLFHFANGAMLPLVGQYLTVGTSSGASLYMSACIIAAQLIMIPMAKFAGKYADIWGRKPVFLIGFAALPVRGFLYTVSDNAYWLVAVQAMDGIGAGIFGVIWVIMVADLTKGTGRYNVTIGAIATVTALGGALSNIVAGFVVDASSYAGGFMFLGSFALLALLVFYFGVPETKNDNRASVEDISVHGRLGEKSA